MIYSYKNLYFLCNSLSLFFAENKPRTSRPVATGVWVGVKPHRGNVSRQICNLNRQINEVSLGSALNFRELGLASFSFMLRNLREAI